MSAEGTVLPEWEFLNQERERVFLKLTRLHETLRSNIDPDIEDGASELEEHEHSSVLIKELERRLKSIDLALEKVRQGTYGICERCGTSIDPNRLEAVPETTLCLSCKMIVEKK